MNKEDYEKYYQKGGSYTIPVEAFNELFDDYECFKNDCQKYKEKIDKLKKQNEEYEKQLKPNYYVKGLEGTLKEYQHTMTKYDAQQKEFIKYFENEIEKYDEFLKNESTNSEYKYLSLKDILYKYKEILGGNNG